MRMLAKEAKAMNSTVVGIDVGGERKGFHAVALQKRKFFDKITDPDSNTVVKWCHSHLAKVVAVDAPCRWSNSGSSRLAERELAREGIHCFFTPTRDTAQNRGFYEWVFNGERLFDTLESHDYPLFQGGGQGGPACIETFPHAVVWIMSSRSASDKRKGASRRELLRGAAYDVGILSNVDFVDAALCAVVADAFCTGKYALLGDRREGFIILPNPLGAR
jgi:predicted nuclease with RNAse H fold